MNRRTNGQPTGWHKIKAAPNSVEMELNMAESDLGGFISALELVNNDEIVAARSKLNKIAQ